MLFPLNAHIDSQLLQSDTRYGQALANSAAREALEAAFRDDKLSMGAVIQNTAANPKVRRVAIRDIEDQLLVQAGANTRDLPKAILTFESAITLHNSISGFITVNIEPSTWLSQLFWGIYMCVFMLCAVLLLRYVFVDAHINITLPERPIRKNPETSSASAETFEDEYNSDKDEYRIQITESTPTPITLYYAHVALNVKNIIVLKQQLNGKTFRETFAELESRLDDIGHLYNACTKDWHEDRYLISFSANNQHQAIFNTLCAARLMLDTCGIVHRVPLDLSAQVSVDMESLTDIEMPFVGLSIDDATVNSAKLEDTVHYLEIGDDTTRRLISAFCAPYDALLHKQISQLKRR